MSLSPRLSQKSNYEYDYTEDQRRTKTAIASLLKLETSSSVPTCPCGTKSGLTIAERDFLGLPCETTLCPTCGLVRLGPQLVYAEVDQRRHYLDTVYGDQLPQLFSHQYAKGMELSKCLDQLPEKIETMIQPWCGSGGSLVAFQESGVQVRGYETSIDVLQEEIRQTVDVQTGNFSDYVSKQEQDPADLALITDAFDGLTDLNAELQRVLKLVRPGGYLLIEVPGISTIPEVYGGDLLYFLQVPRKHYFTAQTLRFVLERAGLEVMFIDEQIVALARKSEEVLSEQVKSSQTAEHPKDECAAILNFLARMESTLLNSGIEPTNNAKATADSEIFGTLQKAIGLDIEKIQQRAEALNLFFCIGCQKSGTTLLARILDQHPKIACMSESYGLAPATTSSIFNPTSTKWKNHGFTQQQVQQWLGVWNTLSQFAAGSPLVRRRALGIGYLVTMVDVFEDFANRCGAEAVGDKWPWYVDYLDLLMDFFPSAKFIYNTRDPRGIWNSAQNFKNRERGDAVLQEMLDKDQKVTHLLMQPNFIQVRYEDLLSDSGSNFEKLYSFIGLDFSEDYLQYDMQKDQYPQRWDWVPEAKKPLDPSTASKWKSDMSSDQIKSVNAKASWFIEKYNYEL